MDEPLWALNGSSLSVCILCVSPHASSKKLGFFHAMRLYMPLFRACTTLRSLAQLHAHLLVTGLVYDNPLPSTKLVESYAENGSLQSSRLVFETFQNPDSFMYGVFIKCLVWNNLFQEAGLLYHRLVSEETQISNFVFPSVLRACSGLGDLGFGKKIHGRVIKSGLDNDAVIETSLLCMYGETRCLDDAKNMFDEMSVKDVVAWSTVVSCFVENGEIRQALKMFSDMVNDGVEPDPVTMISVAEACAEMGCLRLARSIHGHIVKKTLDLDESPANSLVVMYSKCGDVFSAERVFINTATKCTTTLWTAMISSYNRRGFSEEALELFLEMLKSEIKPNSVTLNSVLSSCAMLGRIKEGKAVHCFVIRRGVDPEYDYVGPALIDFYAEYGKICDCEKVLHSIGERDIVSWNILISIYVQKGLVKEALILFIRMLERGIMPDSFSLASSISACENVGFITLGNQIHGYVTKRGISDEFVQSCLIDMYSKCGTVDSAYMIFDNIQHKSVVTWNSMLCGFSQNGNSTEAINLFDHMYSNRLEMSEVTFLSVIQACSNLGYLEKGKWIHHKLISYGIKRDLYTDTALIDMYAKCGDLQTARQVFVGMSDRNVVSWSAMINGYGMHGQIDAAISTFNQMVESGIEPNEVTFMNILSACGHSGSITEGRYYFNSMKDFGLEPNSEHYACVIDVLSRAGDLQEAYRIIKAMPFPADASIWGSVINGCRVHQRTDIIKAIEKDLLDVRTDDTGYYTLLSNIYAVEGKWDEFGKVRSSMESKDLKKVPGYSTIEID